MNLRGHALTVERPGDLAAILQAAAAAAPASSGCIKHISAPADAAAAAAAEAAGAEVAAISPAQLQLQQQGLAL
jgi:hypothetical protein